MGKQEIEWILCVVVASFLLPASNSLFLSNDYYEKTCPSALTIIRSEMDIAVAKEARMAASILRLHFHDCFVQGCDASVLLDDTPTFTGEKTANANKNSIRGFEVIDGIKEKLESVCPGVVSCADILTVAARDAVLLDGGPYWDVPLGRKDSRSASLDKANSNIPTPNSTLYTLLGKFLLQGLSPTDMVALSGAHTIGQARCTSFKDRIYKGNVFIDSDNAYLSKLKGICPPTGGDNNLSPLDFVSPVLFDNSYYRNIVNGQGLLTSDQELSMYGSITSKTIKRYAEDPLAFWQQFSDSMVKMGNIVNPLTFITGEVRKNCRLVNE